MDDVLRHSFCQVMDWSCHGHGYDRCHCFFHYHHGFFLLLFLDLIYDNYDDFDDDNDAVYDHDDDFDE